MCDSGGTAVKFTGKSQTAEDTSGRDSEPRLRERVRTTKGRRVSQGASFPEKRTRPSAKNAAGRAPAFPLPWPVPPDGPRVVSYTDRPESLSPISVFPGRSPAV